MNTSFELLSSMSPKFNKHQKPNKRTPTKLALKPYFRKSLALENAHNSKDISVITVDSSSTTSFSVDDKLANETPIIISDSEHSFCIKTPKRFSKTEKHEDIYLPQAPMRKFSNEKYQNIQHWVDDVNNAEQDFTVFTDMSAIFGEENSGFKRPNTNIAVNSTLLECAVKRFDEFFQTKDSQKSDSNEHKNVKDQKVDDIIKEKSEKLSLEDSLLSNSDLENKDIEDSLLHLDLNESLSSKIQKEKQCSDETKNNDANLLINDSFESDSNVKNKDDSFELNLDESLNTKIQKKQSSKGTKAGNDGIDDAENEYGDLLDKLYGNSWRDKKDDVLPSSEPRFKKTKNIKQKVPNTERRASKQTDANVNDNNLLRTLQRAKFKKALESPWVASVQNVCDSDTESEDCNHLPHIKLNFDDDFNTKSQPNTINNKNKNQNKKIDPPLKNNITKNKTYSFLASLSKSVPAEKCNMSALIFRDHFHQHKETLAVKLFKLYNETVFDNAIPKETVIEWNGRMRGTAGVCKCKKITRRTGAIERTVTIALATKVLDSADRLRDTLIHEMCHAATWIVNEVSDGHGRFWKLWARRAMKAYPELPQIQRCHNYVINTKYTYKCTGCGYSIGRHTKSLDTNRKRCGYCLGTFEVLINKTSKQGETKSVPATPKKINGFALFVKENYGNFKSPNVNHGEVMKMLGQKFSELKVNKS